MTLRGKSRTQRWPITSVGTFRISFEQLALHCRWIEFANIHRHLPSPEFPELLDCTGAVPSVMIVGERQNLNLSLVNRLQNFDPLGPVCSTVHDDLVPHLRLLLDFFPVSKPTDISEVARGQCATLTFEEQFPTARSILARMQLHF
jgi:hypothetical protein